MGVIAAAWEALAKAGVEIIMLVVGGMLYAIRTLWNQIKENENRMEAIEEELDLETQGRTRLERHNARMDELQDTQGRLMRYMIGDENDPSDAGVLTEISEIHTVVDRIADKIDIAHDEALKNDERMDEIEQEIDERRDVEQ